MELSTQRRCPFFSRYVQLASSAAGRRYASTLVLGEAVGASLSNSTLSAITAAKKIGGPVTVLAPAGAAKAAAAVDGVSKVISVSDKAVDNGIAENVSKLVLQLQAANSASPRLQKRFAAASLTAAGSYTRRASTQL